MAPFPSSLPLQSGAIIGIIGGGQLGRMTALAAARLGYRCHVFCPDADSPAFQVAEFKTVADYRDEKALRQFSSLVDVITFEFENIPSECVRLLSECRPVHPAWNVLETAQDRLNEKKFFHSIGVPTAPWKEIRTRADLTHAISELGLPSVLKTTRFGYDGKGQAKLDSETDLDTVWERLGTQTCILEGFVTFEREISVIAARDAKGTVVCFDPVENRHVNHILDTTIAPAPISRNLSEKAVTIARRSAEATNLVGLLAIEMFVTFDGSILANEMAPRPHNSGHWTMDACYTDQFEQLVRAICGLPLGSAERHSDAEMKNLIGHDLDHLPSLLQEKGVKIHLYGKKETREGRKMGHVNRLKTTKI